MNDFRWVRKKLLGCFAGIGGVAGLHSADQLRKVNYQKPSRNEQHHGEQGRGTAKVQEMVGDV